MLEGLFQPLHLILIVLPIFLVGVLLVFRVLWRLSSKLK
jgi:hypothetical protein